MSKTWNTADFLPVILGQLMVIRKGKLSNILLKMVKFILEMVYKLIKYENKMTSHYRRDSSMDTERLKQLKNLANAGKLGLNDLDVVEALIDDLEYAISLFD